MSFLNNKNYLKGGAEFIYSFLFSRGTKREGSKRRGLKR